MKILFILIFTFFSFNTFAKDCRIVGIYRICVGQKIKTMTHTNEIQKIGLEVLEIKSANEIKVLDIAKKSIYNISKRDMPSYDYTNVEKFKRTCYGRRYCRGDKVWFYRDTGLKTTDYGVSLGTNGNNQTLVRVNGSVYISKAHLVYKL